VAPKENKGERKRVKKRGGLTGKGRAKSWHLLKKNGGEVGKGSFSEPMTIRGKGHCIREKKRDKKEIRKKKGSASSNSGKDRLRSSWRLKKEKIRNGDGRKGGKSETKCRVGGTWVIVPEKITTKKTCQG